MKRLFSIAVVYFLCSLLAPCSSAQVTVENETSISRDELRERVTALYVEETPWRTIDWKTCLIDGLQASKAQGKPMILWIFIDRPIDDERC